MLLSIGIVTTSTRPPRGIGAVAAKGVNTERKKDKEEEEEEAANTTTTNNNTGGGGESGRGVGFGGRRSSSVVLKWQCVEGCGACCKLDKGPTYPTPEEIFQHNNHNHSSTDVQLLRSLIGPDGWCIHFNKSSRTCSIYSDRPYFCRVEPKFSTHYMELTRKGSTRRHAAFAGMKLNGYMVQNQKSCLILTMLQGKGVAANDSVVTL